MAIDSKTERLSVLNFGLPFVRTLPEPSGTVAQADRQHLLALCGSILVGAADEPVALWNAVLDYYIAGAASHDAYLPGSATHDAYVAGAATPEGGIGG